MQDEFGETALHAASGKGHVEVMTVLVQRGANVNSLNKVCVSILFNFNMCVSTLADCMYVYGMYYIDVCSQNVAIYTVSLNYRLSYCLYMLLLGRVAHLESFNVHPTHTCS